MPQAPRSGTNLLRGADHEGTEFDFMPARPEADEGTECGFMPTSPEADEGDECGFYSSSQV